MNQTNIIVGTGFTASGHTLDDVQRAAALAGARSLLLREYGGFTETIATGGWMNPDGEPVLETSVTFTMMHPAVSNDTALLKAKRVGSLIAGMFQQASVFVSTAPTVAAFVEPAAVTV